MRWAARMRDEGGAPPFGWVVALALFFQPLRAEVLTIATYNVENYVAADRLVDGTYREGYPKPEAAKAALRAVIRALDADVLALQEMGPRAYLDELRRDLKSEGLDYAHAELLEAVDAERHVAILSRRPLAQVRGHADLTFKYFGVEERVKRGLLEVRITTEGGSAELTVFVAHLKSRYMDRADDPLSERRRVGEAIAVRDRVLKIFPEPARARFVVVGDFNDGPQSKTLRALTQRGKTEIAEVLPATDSRGETWTHFYRKEDSYSRVDYVLVSPGLKPAVVGDGKASIFDGAETRAASDHRPVVVRVKVGVVAQEEVVAKTADGVR